ncbi:MAG TPA: type III-B CRISPR module RAMP protein Cmr4 [Armatimonadota bacterium]|mgnify:FL=1|jgi:CRISPR-associated protein Cmr4|nr:type III-B CRISPR module RAMP protein Cmr4 [Armatimonadota bacterium]HOJ22505.1 type III-B CRISPR module RAMP protein Cmr4 [Armatimonadota bacterium]HOM80973.1 type III-B CRISPR module RAMP protein Cmr4 [Armatimonadota bacterium]HPO73560.1 type III-B CRISPR module RAMP protein Cmr4 [Armatimonadota bacterium]
MSSGILFLRAQTPMHPGSGTSVGAVDLPVQRERYTNWPVIQGSALKGVLRSVHRDYLVGAQHQAGNTSYTLEDADADPELVEVFGKAGEEGELHAGALAVTDARILAFPVRSAKGIFVWVTCAAVLSRAIRDLQMAGLTSPFDLPAAPGTGKAVSTSNAIDIWVEMENGPKLVLEDILFTPVTAGREELDRFAGWLATAGCGYAEEIANGKTEDGDPRRRLVLISGDAFKHLVTYATEIATRIRLGLETKTVVGGALFTQELLPAETIFYSVLLASKPRSQNPMLDAAGVIGKIKSVVEEAKVLQVGGDETTGKGWCWARVWPQAV